MTETKHGVDASFNDRLNILRAGVLGANDGIISIAGVVIGVASATSNLWIIFLSGLSAILAGAFSMAGGEYVSVSTQKDTEEAAVSREQALLDRDPKAARDSLYAAYIQNGECETAAQIMTERSFLKHPLKALVEEKYGLEFEEFTNPWHAGSGCYLEGLHLAPHFIDLLCRELLRHADDTAILTDIPLRHRLIPVELNAIALWIFEIESFTVAMVRSPDKGNLQLSHMLENIRQVLPTR